MKESISLSEGNVNINADVIAKYAGLTAIECFGIVGMASKSMKDGISRLLKRENLSKGIDVRVDEGGISVDFHIIVAYGISIETIAANLIENVTYKLEELTGMHVKEINIFVDGVRVID